MLKIVASEFIVQHHDLNVQSPDKSSGDFYNLIMKKSICSLIILMTAFYSVNAQVRDTTWNLEYSAGVSLRSTVMHFFRFGFVELYSSTIQDYEFEKNLQGLSFQPSIKVTAPHSRWSLQFIPSIRYDVTYEKVVRIDTVDTGQHLLVIAIDKEMSEFIFEPNISLMRRINDRSNVGVGATLVNTGKRYTDYEGNHHNLQFYTIDLTYQRKLKRLLWEAKVHYLREGQFPRDPLNDFLMYSFRFAWYFPNAFSNSK